MIFIMELYIGYARFRYPWSQHLFTIVLSSSVIQTSQSNDAHVSRFLDISWSP